MSQDIFVRIDKEEMGECIMQFVKTEDLKPGMRLAKPIYNRLGVLLYERNTKLTPQGIASIRKFSIIGIYILEPAEPLPPLSEEEIQFEKFQTVYMFRLRDEYAKIAKGEQPDKLYDLCTHILREYGNLNHQIAFSQNIRSSGDFLYKHGLSVAILCAMISHKLGFAYEEQLALVEAALLYDLGYLYLDSDKITDTEDPDSEDYAQLCAARQKALLLLRPQNNEYNLPKLTLKTISEMTHPSNHKDHAEVLKKTWGMPTLVLRVADRFDQITAMRYGSEPQSEVQAVNYLMKYPDFYKPDIVRALSECIHILPQGACVDLSDGEKAMILESNPVNFLQPLILKFSDNKIYDLGDPKVHEELQIVDIMKTMDNRISIDEETLKQFKADKHIVELANRFRKAKAKIARKLRRTAPPTLK